MWANAAIFSLIQLSNSLRVRMEFDHLTVLVKRATKAVYALTTIAFVLTFLRIIVFERDEPGWITAVTAFAGIAYIAIVILTPIRMNRFQKENPTHDLKNLRSQFSSAAVLMCFVAFFIAFQDFFISLFSQR